MTNLPQLLADLEAGKVSATYVQGKIISDYKKLLEKITFLENDHPYESMLQSLNKSTRNDAECALLGWKGGIATVRIMASFHLDISEPVKKD